MVVGPLRRLDLGDGVQADFYVLRYTQDGGLDSPHTERMLRDSLGPITDVYLFSHGWNNTFDDAVAQYQKFVDGYVGQRGIARPRPPGYRPVLVGVVWPSISLVLPWEQGPQIAAEPNPDAEDAARMRDYVTGAAADA